VRVQILAMQVFMRSAAVESGIEDQARNAGDLSD
jgi:hypothetical protein